jgi:hypothetical protein
MDAGVENLVGRGSTWRQFAPRALAGMSVAAVGATALLAIAIATGGALEVQVGTRPPQDITVGAVVVMIVLSGVGAWVTAAVATRLTPRPRLTFLAASTLVLALSLLPPTSAATGSAVWWLEAMHLVVFTAVVAALAPAVPARRAIGQDHLASVRGGSA